MNSTDRAIREHMRTAAELVQLALAQVQQDDPQAAAHLACAYKGGAMLQLRATLAASGIASLAVEVIEPNGTTHTLSSCELQREAIQ